MAKRKKASACVHFHRLLDTQRVSTTKILSLIETWAGTKHQNGFGQIKLAEIVIQLVKEKAITTLSNRITSHVTYGNDIGTPYQRHSDYVCVRLCDCACAHRNHINSQADQHFHSIYRYLASWNGSNITGRLFFFNPCTTQ